MNSQLDDHQLESEKVKKIIKGKGCECPDCGCDNLNYGAIIRIEYELQQFVYCPKCEYRSRLFYQVHDAEVHPVDNVNNSVQNLARMLYEPEIYNDEYFYQAYKKKMDKENK